MALVFKNDVEKRWDVIVGHVHDLVARAAVPAGRKDSLPGARTSAHACSSGWSVIAYASRALDAELARYPQLEQRERALATELVYGSLRTRRVLESRLGRHAPEGSTGSTPGSRRTFCWPPTRS